VAALPERRPERRPREADALWIAAAASAVAFLIYLPRLCPTLSLSGDSAELVTAAALWGVPHPPGYPMFTAIAHAFTWLPLHDLPWRVHLTSAVFHAGAVGATVVATFSITKSRASALAAGCALGLERSFFLGSLYAEVFPLNDLLFALLIGLALRLRAPGAPGKTAFAAVAGIAAAHHMMIALAAPSLAILALRPLAAAARARARSGLALAGAFSAPFLVYALVPIAASREPALSWGDVHDARSFLALVTRSDYGGLLSPVHGSGRGLGWEAGLERVAALGGLLGAGFGVPTLALAAIGAAWLLRARTQRSVGASLVLGALASGPLFAWLNALGTGTEGALAFFERFATMCTIPIGIAFGAGVAAVEAALTSARPSARAPRVLVLVALATWALLCFVRVRDVDLRADDRGIAFAHDLVLRAPDRALILVSGDAPTNAALYVCAVERACGDRVVLSPGSLFMPWAMAEARRRHPELDIPWKSGSALKRTHELARAEVTKRAVLVYPDLLEKDPLLAESFTPVPDHLLFRLWPRESDWDAERDAFLESARAFACLEPSTRDEPCPPCEGCLLPYPRVHPTQEAELAAAYEAAALNHARFGERVPEARALLPLLLTRAGDYARTPSR
jgi:Protein of unknown function (DUF2723)